MSGDLEHAHDQALYVAENELGWRFQEPDAASAASAAYERGWVDAISAAEKVSLLGATADPAYREMSIKMNAALAELASIKLATRYPSRHPFKIESTIAVTFGPKDSMTWNDATEGEVSR